MVFNTALSGIQAASKGLDVLGHNIANSATIGFKSSRAEFQDVYSLGTFGGGATTVGSGVRLSRVQQNFGQGNTFSTDSALDLAITGPGFFILNDQGTKVYSRAGAFESDDKGFIVNSSRQRLTGRLADANGNITNTIGDLVLNKANINPKASSFLAVGVNMPSKDVPPALDWSGGATPSQDSYSEKTSATVFDSLGNSHIISMFYIKADPTALAGAPNAASPPGTANQWYVAVQIDNQNVPANVGVGNTNNLFRVNFNSGGVFTTAEDTGGNPLPNNQIPISTNLGNGSNVFSINLDLSKSTQFGSSYSEQSISPDGYTTGSLGGLSIGTDGILFGNYSNGVARPMGQLQLADFPNTGGLQSLGGTCWAETADSGQVLVNNPGSGDLGLVKSQNLEDSNVDLTGELVGLISAQRAFQANAQTIKTADAITQTIINIR
jgi:flagellar hook protein FlgE